MPPRASFLRIGPDYTKLRPQNEVAFRTYKIKFVKGFLNTGSIWGKNVYGINKIYIRCIF